MFDVIDMLKHDSRICLPHHINNCKVLLSMVAVKVYLLLSFSIMWGLLFLELILPIGFLLYNDSPITFT